MDIVTVNFTDGERMYISMADAEKIVPNLTALIREDPAVCIPGLCQTFIQMWRAHDSHARWDAVKVPVGTDELIMASYVGISLHSYNAESAENFARVFPILEKTVTFANNDESMLLDFRREHFGMYSHIPFENTTCFGENEYLAASVLLGRAVGPYEPSERVAAYFNKVFPELYAQAVETERAAVTYSRIQGFARFLDPTRGPVAEPVAANIW